MFKTNSPLEAFSESQWQKCLEKILVKIGPASYETWFRTTDFSINHGNANILVPNQFFADFIEEHFLKLIEEILKKNRLHLIQFPLCPRKKNGKLLNRSVRN